MTFSTDGCIKQAARLCSQGHCYTLPVAGPTQAHLKFLAKPMALLHQEFLPGDLRGQDASIPSTPVIHDETDRISVPEGMASGAHLPSTTQCYQLHLPNLMLEPRVALAILQPVEQCLLNLCMDHTVFQPL